MNSSLQKLSIIEIPAFRIARGGDMTSGLNLFENADTAMSVLSEQIDSLIGKIRDEICVSHPEQLLFQIAELSWMNGAQVSDDTIMFGPISENYYPVEYIQSLLMVEQLHEPREVSAEELSRIGYTVLKDVQDLFILALRYEVAWAAQLSNVFDEELSKFAFEAQLMYKVRGKRYQAVQRQYYEPLLLPHDAELKKVFGISAVELVEGLMRIEHALSQGKLNNIVDVIGAAEGLDNGFDTPPEELSEAERFKLIDACRNAFTVAKYNVERITGWPAALIRELSYSIGEGEYYDKGKYQYWPIVAQPIWERPFITINGETYCFDYWSTMDNFYRSLQKALGRKDPGYADRWTAFQQEASERMVADIFSKILPGASIYTNNYYGSKKNRDENDILVLYHDIMVIVEVKAGAFTYAPPITDVSSHVDRYKALIERADYQCFRLKDYLDSCDGELELFVGNKATSPRKATIDLRELTDVFTISVTLENVNEFAARAEKLSFLNMEDGGISIAVDDLLTYQNIFDSPLVFLHFLRQRRLASRNERLALFDELDHLGMYIEHNCYPMEVEEIVEDADLIIFDGYREELDNYFNLLSNGVAEVEKPVQAMPALFKELIEAIEKSDVKNKVQLSSYYLDFASDTREKYSRAIAGVIERQKVTGTLAPINLAGGEDSIRQTTFVVQPSLTHLPAKDEMIEYASAIMLAYEEGSRWLTILYFDNNDALEKVESEFIVSDEIAKADRARLLAEGRANADYRVARYIEKHGKIGRNEPCPCGSGKKYKRCHGDGRAR